jgi:hypothetical protein
LAAAFPTGIVLARNGVAPKYAQLGFFRGSENSNFDAFITQQRETTAEECFWEQGNSG